jgi:uncharacterized membrane protein YagU involved in acid resistance
MSDLSGSLSQVMSVSLVQRMALGVMALEVEAFSVLSPLVEVVEAVWEVSMRTSVSEVLCWLIWAMHE